MDGLEKWWAIGLLPIALVAVWWLWWKLPERKVAKLRHSIRDPKDRVDVEDTLRKTIGQAIGAIAVLIGAGFAVWQFLEQRDTAQKQIAVSQQQVQASHDLLVSNQIAKGFEQLGSDKIEVRLGGIYALEGILRMPPPDQTSPDYRQPVLEALCAFVREHTIGKTVAERPTPGVPAVLPHPTTDVQAVLTVIGRRPKELKPVDLIGAVVPGAVLPLANLSGAGLVSANLSGAGLVSANLSGANLISANLSGAYLVWANLSGAYLSGAKLNDADLSGADLTGVSLDNQEQLSMACGKPKELPEGFTLNRPCPPHNPK
jgi:Pentapeptide repeats (8 copies)